MRPFCLTAALVAAFLVSADAVVAAGACAARAELVAALLRDWDGRPRFRGLAASGALIEILVAPAGSWSAVVTRPDGVACLAAAGEGGEVTPPGLPAVTTPDAPS